MSTAREELDRRLHRARWVAFAGWAVAVIGMFLNWKFGNGHPTALVAFLAGFVVFAGAVLYTIFGIRCPRCRKPIGNVVHSGLRKVEFCPFCGLPLNPKV